MKSKVLTGAALGTAALFAAVLVPEPAYSHKPITTNILYKNEIAQIFQRKCFQCHSENNLAMALTTYAEARPWARAIREEILDREMPPWQAVPGYGSFTNDLSLNTREKEIILSWTDGGAPSGVLKADESVAPVYVPSEPAWDHGVPDLVLPISIGHVVASGAPFGVARFVVDTKLPAAKRVRAIALKQGDRRVVRHAAFYEESTGRWIGGWTPWQTTSQFASNAVVSLPAKARVVVEMGYSGTDADVVDKSELGLYFDTDERSASRGDNAVAMGLSIQAAQGRIEGGATAQRVRAETKVDADTRLLAFWPNPGKGAISVELSAIFPDGTTTPLLWINHFRAEWQSPYLLAEEVKVPRGSRLIMTTYFDNPRNEPLVTRPQLWVITAGAARPVSARQK
jgi:hypothetical protein